MSDEYPICKTGIFSLPKIKARYASLESEGGNVRGRNVPKMGRPCSLGKDRATAEMLTSES